ncbi:hypothetical protein BS47DRAFT_898378 [Hydnum rufescens UP504]|uniref:Uncharacterized protein n=1 Tax=Hydnum rufescens UP504 TaxID=1448309 RepID=A0A9P6AYM8_9AGAM|nr:hypothetical protein BS47DRAFT_898378 [Hydnum rufescens UP504]
MRIPGYIFTTLIRRTLTSAIDWWFGNNYANINCLNRAALRVARIQRYLDQCIWGWDLPSSGTFPNVTTPWHTNVAYISDPLVLAGDYPCFATGNKMCNWAPLGMSTRPDVNVVLFTASINQDPSKLSRIRHALAWVSDFTRRAESKGKPWPPPTNHDSKRSFSAVLVYDTVRIDSFTASSLFCLAPCWLQNTHANAIGL